MTIIDQPGLYDLPEDAYHADPCVVPSLSSSIGKKLIHESPRHAWEAHPRLNPNFQRKEKAAFDGGKVAHKLMLGKGAELAVINAPDWRTKAAKEAREDAYNAGQTPILVDQMAAVEEMVAAGRKQLDDHEDDAMAFRNGKPEVTLIWQEGKVWCRAMLDWMPNEGGVFYDYKSTGQSANPDTFGRPFFNLGYDFQAAFYRRGIRKVLGIAEPHFKFVVQENYSPFALSTIGVPPAALDDADTDVQQAIDLWASCLEHDLWPGYPRRTCYVHPPGYIMAQRLDREAREGLQTTKPSKEALRQSINWMAPLKGDAA
jgi:hypothetical protein